MQKSFRSVIVLSSFVGVICAGRSAQASFLGTTVDLQYDYPTQSTVYQDYGAMVVGVNGAKYSPVFGSALDVVVGGPVLNGSTASVGSTITLDNFASGDVFTGTYDGPDVILETPGQIITGVTLDPSSFSTFTPQLSFTADSVSANLTGLSTATSPSIQLDVTFASVPEPASVALIAVAGMGLLTRRRRI